jgi:membrane associated rhomboid family serine protease
MEQASLTTRIKVWLDTIPLFTKILMFFCVILYILQLLTDFPQTQSVCFSPYDLIINYSHFYRMLTAIFFHAGIMHILFNMMAHLSLGTTLEIKLGTTHVFLSVIFFGVFAASFQLVLGSILYYFPNFTMWIQNTLGKWIITQIFSCGIGYSGVLFAQMVTSGYVFGPIKLKTK